jgi:hypothetical protein
VFLDSLFDDIADGRFGPLNHTHHHLFGFSSGGFWVSRMIAENSGLLKTSTGRPWPEIASAVMLCGGSFETYNGANAPPRLAGWIRVRGYAKLPRWHMSIITSHLTALLTVVVLALWPRRHSMRQIMANLYRRKDCLTSFSGSTTAPTA